jgi:hypothetical protein
MGNPPLPKSGYISGKQLCDDHGFDTQRLIELIYAGDLTAYRLVSVLQPFYPSMNPPFAGCKNPKPYPKEGLPVSMEREAEYRRIPAADVGRIDVVEVLAVFFDLDEIADLDDAEAPEHIEQEPQKSIAQDCSLCRSGAGWILKVCGRSYPLKNKVGVRYLAQLLQNPGKEISVLDLAKAPAASADFDALPEDTLAAMDGMTAEQLEESGFRVGQALYDHEDSKEIEKDRQDIQNYMQEQYDNLCKAKRDDEPETKFEKEMNMLQNVKKFRTIIGKDGRVYLKFLPQVNPDAVKVRDSVKKRLREAKSEVDKLNDPDLTRWTNFVRTKGFFCTYSPEGDAPTTWLVKT